MTGVWWCRRGELATGLYPRTRTGIITPPPNKFNALTAPPTVTIKNRRSPLRTARILLLAPPLGRPSSWRPDGGVGAVERVAPVGRRLKARRGLAERIVSLRGRPVSRPDPDRRELPLATPGTALQARAEIARAVRKGRFPSARRGPLNRERVKTPRPERLIG